ncbi:MAG TPA: nuclear transport factor 2 family protein [Solirubrobacteraceae bacterium]|nr:nuclear transport factor 2 family protein [Solirubrobacteraceae bacterium]
MIEELVRRLYEALATGDADAVGKLLAPDFQGSFAPGMPFGLGGRKDGMASTRDDGWWAIGRGFSVRVKPEEWIPCADGRLLVIGRYVGRARASGRGFEAEVAHLWSAAGDRLTSVHQFTDTVMWRDALEERA